jgi:TRAP-type mannitol/chloroaromatic compound transport system permease small subunit
MLDAALWVITNIGAAFYNTGYAILNPGTWLDWSDPVAKVRFIYYGGSVEFFFVVFTTFLVLTGIGFWKRTFLWGLVRGLEGFANVLGRFAAWAGLLMVLQQIMIVFLQRIFRVSEITLGPFGTVFTRDLSWYSEELKLYNAVIVCLCVSYTFVQGGHVRVDLVYAAVSHRTKRVIDMLGSILFMMPVMVLTWMYAWFFMWRHLVTPKISASDNLDLLERKARILKWNVETIGFSPNGFDAYFLFKVLIVAFCGCVFLQACAFFWRSYLEFVEGEASAGKYLDKDKLGDAEAERAAEIH